MANMNIDLEKLGQIGQEDLTDKKVQQRLYQYLYQLIEQLKYWQYHLEEENLSTDLQAKLEAAGESDVDTGTILVNDSGITVTDKTGNVTMKVGEKGDVIVNSLTTEALTVGGQELGTLLEAFLNSKIIVSETQPEATGVIWLQPSTAGSGTASTVDFTVQGAGQSMNNETGTCTLAMTKSGTDSAIGSTCTYGIRFRVYNISGAGYLGNVRVTVTGEDENGDEASVVILDRSVSNDYIGEGDMITVDTLSSPSESLTNVTFGSTVSVAVRMTFAYSGRRFLYRDTITMRATGEAGEGESADVRDCTVHYIS